jgi:hypothetical protein
MNLIDLFRQTRLLFYRRVYPDQSPVALHTAEPVTINLAGFVKGIDNVHLDVRLSPQFQFHAKKFITAMVDQEAGHTIGNVKKTGPTRQHWDHFQGAYTKMINAVIHQAKGVEGPPLVQLAQIAAIKFLQEEVQKELGQLRNTLRSAIAAGGATVDNTIMELVQQKIWLSRNRASLNYKVLRRLLAPILRAEEGDLGELRYSLMGVRWSLPKAFFNNPLLQTDNPFDEAFLSKHYVLMKQGQPQDNDNSYNYTAIDRILPHLFRSVPPRYEIEAALARAESLLAKAEVESGKLNKKLARTKKSKAVEQIMREKELVERLVTAVRANHDSCLADYLSTHYTWADVPANVDLLFNERMANEHIDDARKTKDSNLLTTWKAQRRFQRRLLSVVERYFRRTGLLKQVVAAYELPPLIKDFVGLLSPGEIHQFVQNRTARKELLEQIKSRNVSAQPLNIDSLIRLARRIDNLSHQDERRLLVKFLKDFLTFRRDLVYFQNLQQVSDTIVLRNDPKELRLSQANRTLYEFYATGEKRTSTKTVLNHVILKADIRGSTAIVEELRKHSLNPASHFSINFYNPLNMVLKAFGASKVFIEGDAVILSMVEHDEVLESRFSVARMCGVGEQLLNIVQAQNTACRENGLPELEIGIGLVYSDEPPLFLFDGDRPIMISSAIARADRLSSCSWMLRRERPEQGHAFSNVEIYEIPEGDRRKGEKGEVYLRYNLNGIELDKEGFFKLQSELTMQEVNLTLPGDDMSTSFFYGRYPDLKGTLRRVVVRRGRIRLFDRKHPQFGNPTAEVFYEVVVNKDLLTQVEEAINYLESMVKI